MFTTLQVFTEVMTEQFIPSFYGFPTLMCTTDGHTLIGRAASKSSQDDLTIDVYPKSLENAALLQSQTTKQNLPHKYVRGVIKFPKSEDLKVDCARQITGKSDNRITELYTLSSSNLLSVYRIGSEMLSISTSTTSYEGYKLKFESTTGQVAIVDLNDITKSNRSILLKALKTCVIVLGFFIVLKVITDFLYQYAKASQRDWMDTQNKKEF